MERLPNNRRRDFAPDLPKGAPCFGSGAAGIAREMTDVSDGIDGAESSHQLAITRIVDDEASEAEWSAFCIRAEQVPSLWRELAQEHWIARSLSRAVEARVACVGEAVNPGTFAATTASEERSRMVVGPERDRSSRPGWSGGGWSPGGWAGWMAAACLAGAWVVTDSLRTPFGIAPIPLSSSSAPSGSAPTTPGLAGAGGGMPHVEPPIILRASLTPDEALDAYFVAGKADGSVLGEVPGMPVVERRAAPDGGYDVIYIRQILERRRVPAFFTFDQTDEFGHPIPTPVPMPLPASARADPKRAAF